MEIDDRDNAVQQMNHELVLVSELHSRFLELCNVVSGQVTGSRSVNEASRKIKSIEFLIDTISRHGLSHFASFHEGQEQHTKLWAAQNKTPTFLREDMKAENRPSPFGPYTNIMLEKLPMELVDRVVELLSAQDRNALSKITSFRDAIFTTSATVKMTSDTGEEPISLARIGTSNNPGGRRLVLKTLPMSQHSEIRTLTFVQPVVNAFAIHAKRMLLGLSLASTCQGLTRLEFFGAPITAYALELVTRNFPKLKHISVEKCVSIPNQDVLRIFTRSWNSHVELTFTPPRAQRSDRGLDYDMACFALLLTFGHLVGKYQPQLLSRLSSFYNTLMKIFGIHITNVEPYHVAFAELRTAMQTYDTMSLDDPPANYSAAVQKLDKMIARGKPAYEAQIDADEPGGFRLINCRIHRSCLPSNCYTREKLNQDGDPECRLCHQPQELKRGCPTRSEPSRDLNAVVDLYCLTSCSGRSTPCISAVHPIDIARHIQNGGSRDEIVYLMRQHNDKYHRLNLRTSRLKKEFGLTELDQITQGHLDLIKEGYENGTIVQHRMSFDVSRHWSFDKITTITVSASKLKYNHCD